MRTPLLTWAATAQSHQAWSTEEGLPDVSVHQILQSRDGYLWIATEGGVARFDGFAFRVLNHKSVPAFTSDDVSALAEDASGSLWFGTADGLIEARGASLRRFDERDGLPSSTILSLSAGSDGLLVLTSHGLVRYQAGRFVPAAPASRNILTLKPAEGRLQTSPDGAAWTRTAAAVTIHAPGLPGGKKVLRIGSDLPGTRTTALYIDHQGTGWIGTNRGLFSFNPTSGTAVEPSPPLHAESVNSVIKDREGNLWIGTEASGLHVLRPRKFRSEPAAAGEAVTAGTIASDGVVWFGTRQDGLRSIARPAANRAAANRPVPNTALTSPVILSLASGKRGEVWAGTPDGLNRVSGSTVQQYTSSTGLPDDFVRSVLVDSQGNVWAGTRRGLARIDEANGGKITTFTRAEGLGSDSIGPILETEPAASSVDLWIGTSAGLSHLRNNGIESFSPQANAVGSAVTAIAQDDAGHLWVALHGAGLSLFANGHFHPIASASLPPEITSIAADHQGYLWLRGLQGVFRVALAALSACADALTKCQFPVAHYGVPEGLPSNASAAEGTPSMWQGPRGELWMATRKGIAVADPAHLPVNLVPPPVVLQRFAVDDADVPLGPGDISVSPGHNRYTFDYAALSYTLPSQLRYRYTLEGFDRDWINAGSQRTASYTSLPPRAYRFRVQAQNEDGVWNYAGEELRFRVLPPIYKRWWFYALALLAAAALAWSLFRLRLRVVQRRFALVLNERNRVAREIHDTLAQDFVSVSLQLDLASHMLRTQDFAQASTQLQATRKLVKQGLDSARQSIWNLRADAAADSLPAKLSALAKRHADATPPPHLKIGGAFRKLPATVEENILRIAGESLANSYRHSAATEVSLNLHYEAEALRLTVRDNGQGFSLVEGKNKQGHYGLRGMEERAALLGATLTIKSSPEEGTTVTLLLPLG